MSAPGVAEEVISSNEFGYLQATIDDAKTTIYESEAWAAGTRSGRPVVGDNFEYQIRGSTFTCEIDESIFKEKVGVYPGATNTYKFTYDGIGWLYTDAEGIETTDPINLTDFGITVTGLYYTTNSIIITITDADLQYQNNAKYWAQTTANAKDAIDNLDFSLTMLPSDGEPTVDKSIIDDVMIAYSSTMLGTVTIDKDIFLSQVSELTDYTFLYTGIVWQYNNETVSLVDYGISYTGTAISGNYITINYNQHNHFNFNTPRGLTGDVNFMTFEINPITGMLYMYKPSDLTQVDFEIIQIGDNQGCLGVKINTGGND